MKCPLRRNQFFAILFFLSLPLLCFSQVISPTTSDDNLLNGIWENDSRIVSFSETDEGTIETEIVLKTFYSFYYDGIFFPHESLDMLNFARIDDGLYMQYWVSQPAYTSLGTQNNENLDIDMHEDTNLEIDINETSGEIIETKTEIEIAQNEVFGRDQNSIALTEIEPTLAPGIFWRPANNRKEFAIDTVPIQTEVIGYYIDTQHIYKIRYWLTKANFSTAKAELTLIPDTNTTDVKPKIVFIDKYIQIGESIYTCATGLRTLIRNVTSIEMLPGTPKITPDETILVLDEPYLVLSPITNLDLAITEHNSIIYPPRDGRARFVEPSIYKKLESMTIEDF